MNTIKIRGLIDHDDKIFSKAQVSKLEMAQEELHFLLNRNYPIKKAMTFIANHHHLAVRQSLAVSRATASRENLVLRKSKLLSLDSLKDQTIYIDGFNLIITLEVALSDGMLFIGQDGCVRDLAELRGTYRLIPQTAEAIKLICNALSELEVGQVVFYLDQPVSNSGRLKEKIYETRWPMPVEVDIVDNPDTLLKKLPCVVTGDSIILDECKSWINLTQYIFDQSGLSQTLSRIIELHRDGF